MADTVKCPKCWRVYTHLAELADVHAVGVGLFGTCKCGALVGCNLLWTKAPEYTQADFTETLEAEHG